MGHIFEEIRIALAAHMRSWSGKTVATVPVPELAVALFLSVGVAAGILVQQPQVSRGAAAAAIAMTLPVGWCRRAPVAAAAALAVAAVANGLVYPSVVRCGAALPAVFIVGYFLGARRDWPQALAGLGLCAANVAAQAVWDPKLGSAVALLVTPILCVFFCLGRIVRWHTSAADTLRRRSDELRRRREQTARMTVLADRAQVSEELERHLRGRIRDIGVSGRQALAAGPATAVDRLAGIERDGREALRSLRELVGSLGHMAPSKPSPCLADLPSLVDRTTAGTGRMDVEGESRPLAAGLELAGYRIVEHLLAALDDSATVDVGVRFAAEWFELRVSGPPAAGCEPEAALAAAQQRAELYGGALTQHTTGGVCQTTVRLSLVNAHA